jgi:hypothetical protein
VFGLVVLSEIKWDRNHRMELLRGKKAQLVLCVDQKSITRYADIHFPSIHQFLVTSYLYPPATM